MVYLKDGFGGYKKTDNEEEAVYIGLSKQEYEKQQSDLRVLSITLEKEKAGREHDKAILEKRTERKEKELEQKYWQDVAVFEDEKKQLEQEIDQLRALNESLLMESKKQTSIARNIKKDESKYRLVNRVIQSKTTVKLKGKESYEAEIWIATLETPYSCLLPLDGIIRNISCDIWAVLGEIGVHTIITAKGILWKGSYLDALERLAEGSIVFDYHFQINVQSRLWEIQVTSTGPFQLTEDLLPPKRDEYKDKSGKKKEKKKKEEKTVEPETKEEKITEPVKTEPETSEGGENNEINTEEPFVIPWD